MIEEKNGVFTLQTDNTSYILAVTEFSHLRHLHYGARISAEDAELLAAKTTALPGSTVLYSEENGLYSLDTLPLEWSGDGKGDYRHSPCELKMPDGGFVTDFLYRSYEITAGCVDMPGLPCAHGGDETLILTLADGEVTLKLYYTVFCGADVITRRCELINNGGAPLSIRRLMSMSVDMALPPCDMLTLSGGWIREGERTLTPVNYGVYVNESMTGSSSNRHNPGVLLVERGTTETAGRAYGFNLVYSGNHYTAVERSARETVRIMTGINPRCFDWTLSPGESFSAPEAALTYSEGGYGGITNSFHRFVNAHIVRGSFAGEPRPVLLNSWEALGMDFTMGKLTRLARSAAKLGVELFVLDDGWFAKRHDDKRSLGDYDVNQRKLPGGLFSLARRVNRLGMKFGLWVEPECVNEDSDLFRAHPDWAVGRPGRRRASGRHQYVLDLTRAEVRDYIVASVRGVLSGANIEYIKWDMNRHITDMYSAGLANQGEFFHRYILGLYEIIERIFEGHPGILFESCSSGGNRFDLGMLCFSPQIWTSDDTDPAERIRIQDGLSLFYPLSAMGAHVSCAPHQQTLRNTSLSTRVNVACFGLLGYELDVTRLSYAEKKRTAADIAFYKKYRILFQYGRFVRNPSVRNNKTDWQVTSPDGRLCAALHYQSLSRASEGQDILPLSGLLPEARYRLFSKPQDIDIRRFGGLINFITPVKLNPEGLLVRTAARLFRLPDCREEYTASGRALMCGVRLPDQFIGSYYNDRTRLLSDFGSTLYIAEAI